MNRIFNNKMINSIRYLNPFKWLQRTKYARHINVSLSSKFNSGILTIIYDFAWSASKSRIRPRESAERFSNSRELASVIGVNSRTRWTAQGDKTRIISKLEYLSVFLMPVEHAWSLDA